MKTGKYLRLQTPPQWVALMFRYKVFKKLIKAKDVQRLTKEFAQECERISLTMTRWKTEVDAMMLGPADETQTSPPSRTPRSPKAKSPVRGQGSSRAAEPAVRFIKNERLRAQASAGPSQAVESIMARMSEAQLDDIAEKVADLCQFIFLNRLALRKISKKIDKNFDDLASNTLLPDTVASGQLIITMNTQPYYTALSKAYTALRERHARCVTRAGDAEEKREDESKQPQGNAAVTADGTLAYVRATTKYWVPLDKVPRLMVEVLKYLPLYVFNENISPWVSSVYLDSEDLSLYKDRIQRIEGARAVRIRWYGDDLPKTLFLERKIHREKWGGAESVKERLNISYDNVVGWMSGKAAAKRTICENKLGKEVVGLMDDIKMRPLVQTSCQRFAFQKGEKDASVRISLDTDLKFIPVGQPPWGTHTFHPNTTNFPFAILEIKLQIPSPPMWLDDILKQPWVHDVPNFSKFIQGLWSIYPERCSAKPYWQDGIQAMLGTEDDPNSKKKKKDKKQDKPKRAIMPLPSPKTDTEASDSYADKDPRFNYSESDTEKTGGKPMPGSPSEASLLMNKDEERHQGKGEKATAAHVAIPMETEAADGAADDKKKKGKFGGFFNKNWLFKRNTNKDKAKAEKVKTVLPMKVEPKTFFANERTFIRWASIGIHLLTVAAAIAVYTAYSVNAKGGQSTQVTASWAMGVFYFVLVLPFLIIGYSMWQYLQRDKGLKTRNFVVVGDAVGPVVLTMIMMLTIAFLIYFILSATTYVPPFVPKAGPNCTSVPVAPTSSFGLRFHRLGDARAASSSAVYVASNSYVLDFNPSSGSLAAPYTVAQVDPTHVPARQYEALEFDKTTGYVFLGDQTINARTLVVANPATWAVVATLSVESFFLPHDKIRFGGMTINQAPGNYTNNMYDVFISGSFSWVYQLRVAKDFTSVQLFNVLPMGTLSATYTSYISMTNWDSINKVWNIPPSVNAQIPSNAAAVSQDVVGSMDISAGTLYVARALQGTLEMYSIIQDLSVTPAAQSLAWSATVAYPPAMQGGTVEGLYVTTSSVIVATDFPASIQKLYWTPDGFFGCFAGYVARAS